MASSEELATGQRSAAARLRQTVDAKTYIKGTTAELASQFGYSELTQEVGKYIEATLADVGLRVKPSLTKCEAGTTIRVSESSPGPEAAVSGIVLILICLVLLVVLLWVLVQVLNGECGFGGPCD